MLGAAVFLPNLARVHALLRRCIRAFHRVRGVIRSRLCAWWIRSRVDSRGRVGFRGDLFKQPSAGHRKQVDLKNGTSWGRRSFAIGGGLVRHCVFGSLTLGAGRDFQMLGVDRWWPAADARGPLRPLVLIDEHAIRMRLTK